MATTSYAGRTELFKTGLFLVVLIGGLLLSAVTLAQTPEKRQDATTTPAGSLTEYSATNGPIPKVEQQHWLIVFVEEPRWGMPIWFWLIPVIIALVFLIAALRRLILGPPLERLQRAMAGSAEPLNQLRTRLEEIKDRKKTAYISELTTKPQQVVQHIMDSIDLVLRCEQQKVDGVVKLCNHKLFVLALKRSLKSTASAIKEDYNRILRTLPIQAEQELSLGQVIGVLQPLLRTYEEALKQLPSVESEIARSAKEYDKISKPGVFRKVSYFFNSKKKKRDAGRLRQIQTHWKQCRDLWAEIHQRQDLHRKGAEMLLDDFLQKLLVFHVCEQVILHVVYRRKPTPTNLGQAVQGMV